MKNILLCLIVLFSYHLSAQVPSYVPANDLIGYWPFNGNANDESGNGNVKIRITDANGRLIQSSEFSSAQILDLNISEASGVYLLTVESSYQRAVIRLVKQ
jgi:hypothetical protein